MMRAKPRFFSKWAGLVVLVLPAALLSSAAAQEDPVLDFDTAINGAKNLIKSGEYDRATELLEGLIQSSFDYEEILREAYLLLIKTYVSHGNFARSQVQGGIPSELLYAKARTTIRECLFTAGLRHTVPEPAIEFPPEMIAMFQSVRAEAFGSFRIAKLSPMNAEVKFDGEDLGAFPGDTLLGDTDLDVNRSHQLVIRAGGYKDFVEDVVVSPNSTLEKPYALSRKRSKWWYSAGGTLVAGTIYLIASGLAGGGDSPATVDPLPGPPNPPQ